jgi:UDP-N-acetylmuramate--alanine ligase
MMPLALILKSQGHDVAGSDRSLDQGRTAPKFEWLKARGMRLFPQDGSGVTSADQIVVASTAVESSVPDVIAAERIGARRMVRAELLAEQFNAASTRIAVGGTSGKSTVTGMIGWIFHITGRDPTVMNGALMKNFITDDTPFASALVGAGDAFISEVDESDGSIALYTPDIAVLNNIAHDHKSMAELRLLFGGYIGKAQTAVLNLDNDEVSRLAANHPPGRAMTYSLGHRAADLFASGIVERADGIDFLVNGAPVSLQVPGKHNASNALAALAVARLAGIALEDAAQAISGFAGLRRRLEVVGSANGITVIDDFGHNPDKIAATLKTLHAFPGRLLIMFQPHGYGPLRQMGDELAQSFIARMTADDILIMPDPVYFGGTVDRSRGSDALIAAINAGGRNGHYIPQRSDCADQLIALAKPGDRIVIMGARDDTLAIFAQNILSRLERT